MSASSRACNLSMTVQLRIVFPAPGIPWSQSVCPGVPAASQIRYAWFSKSHSTVSQRAAGSGRGPVKVSAESSAPWMMCEIPSSAPATLLRTR